jgi:hypothetical protein
MVDAELSGRRILNQATFQPFVLGRERIDAIPASPVREVQEIARAEELGTFADRRINRGGGTSVRYAFIGPSAFVNRSASSVADRAWRYRSVVVMRACPIADFTDARSTPPATSSEP